MEIVIVLAVIVVLASFATISFNSSRTNKLLKITATDIVFALEEAKSNALAGKGGLNQGMYVTTSTYTTFGGASYSAGNTTNQRQTINSALTLSTTAPSSTVLFTRISGNANAVSTTTIAEVGNPSNKIEIVVGTLGSITMVE